MENNVNIDEHLKRALAEFEVQPMLNSFDAVIQKMNAQKKRRRFIILFWSGFGIFFSMVISLTWLYFSAPQKTSARFLAKKETPSGSCSSFTAQEKQNIALQQKQQPKKNSKTNIALLSSATPINRQKTGNIPLQKEITETGKKNTATPSSFQKNKTQLFKATSFIDPGKKADTLVQDLKNTVGSLYLPHSQVFLPHDTLQPELIALLIDTNIQTPKLIPDSLLNPPEKKKVHFYFGINLNPQLTSSFFTGNPQHNSAYNSSDNFPALYLDGRKKHNSLHFNYAFGLKAGFTIKDKYELFFGFGVQRYEEKERLFNYGPVTTPGGPSNVFYDYAPDLDMPNYNIYNYLYYSAEINRVYKTNSFFKYKLGFGLHANQLLYADYIYVHGPNSYYMLSANEGRLTKWSFIANIKTGVILNAGKRWQFQLCPDLFIMPNSIFKKEYVIKQRPYGLELECMVLFKFL